MRMKAAFQEYKNAAPAERADALAGLEKDKAAFQAAVKNFQTTGQVETSNGATAPDFTEFQARVTNLIKDIDRQAAEVSAAGGDAAGEQRLTTQVMPKTATPAQKQAQNAINGGQPGAAEKTLDQAIKNDPNDAAAVALRAQARLAQGNRAGALEDAHRALQLDPNDHAARALVSELEGLDRAAQKFKSAKLDFGQALDAGAGRGGPDGRPRGGPAGLGGREERRAVWSPADVPAPSGAAPVPPALRSLFQTAQERAAIGDFTGALLVLRQIVDLDPKRGDAWEQIAEASNKAKNFLGAVMAADEALKLDPNDARALRARAFAELGLGNYVQALADIERAVSLDPKNGLGYLYRAMIEEKLGDRAKAIKDYQEASRLDPTLIPNVEEALKRLGAGAAPAAGPGRSALGWFRGGAIAASTLLIVLGLMGTATGRRLTTRAREFATGRLPSAAGAAPDQAPATVAIGAFIGGHYRVTRELGRGGMGVVYQALDETLRRPVAIKQMQSEFRANPEDLERFLREARLVAQLRHPHIAEIYSVVAEGDLLLVFEYIDGQPLDRLLAPGKTLAPELARRILCEIGSALEYAHQRRIVHRDLKPSNVMLAADGTVKVMDFGIAHQSASGATQTKTAVSGTPPYMSPEQGMGSVSKASDLYALGVMAYEMLTGARPFEGPDFLEAKLEKRYAPASARNPALPRRVDEFFARALDPDPTKRHADAAEFVRAFAAAFDATPSRA